MQKIDKIVWKETKYIAAWVLVLSGVAVVANFFAMALAVQRAVAEEEKQARQTMRVSNAVRMLAMFAVLAVGVLLPLFNTWTVIVPFVFPRLIVAVRPALDRAKQKKGGRA